MDICHLTAWAGLVGPLLFTAVYTLEGWWRPDYQARRMFVSELSLGPRGWVQILNFVVFGVLLVVFAAGLAVTFQQAHRSLVGPVLLGVMGLALLGSGPLVMDPASTPRQQMTLRGRLHALLGAIVFLLIPVTCFVFLRSLAHEAGWNGLWWWTLATGLFTAVDVVLFSVGPTRPPAAPNAWNSWSGVLQRGLLVPLALWLMVFAAVLLT